MNLVVHGTLSIPRHLIQWYFGMPEYQSELDMSGLEIDVFESMPLEDKQTISRLTHSKQ